MRHFSVRPSLTLRGRKFKGLRGYAGKPFHPPLTDIPIGAYVIAAALDVISTIGGADHGWASELWHAATFVFIAGAIVSVFTALTGFFDWWRSSDPGTQARRTANVHALIMVSVTVAVLVNIALRLNWYNTHDVHAARHHDPVSAHRTVRRPGRDLRRFARVRLRLQRRNRERQPRMARVGDRPLPRRPRVIAGPRLRGL